MYFLVTEGNGPNWDPILARREQPGWPEQAAFMDSLVDDGFVILGGPFGSDERVLLVVDADDEATVRARLEEDLWITQLKILSIDSIEPWEVLLRRD
ncbi:MAG: hypothetical protein ACXVDD_28525 [Polyangia bacterium]